MEQDAFEDYIKHCRHAEEPKKENSQDSNSIIKICQKKKECEDKAIKIVELLIEGSIRPETFLKCIIYINSSYYQDIVEERALTKLCGYPLCDKKIRNPTKLYSVSTKNKKVYDLNEYGFFCSIFCYNASNHIKKQIDDSPLWLREFDNTPTFQLLPKDKGHSSEGVNLKLNKVTRDNDKKKLINLCTILEKEKLSIGNKPVSNLDNRTNNKLHTIAESEIEYLLEENKIRKDYISKNEGEAENSGLSSSEEISQVKQNLDYLQLTESCKNTLMNQPVTRNKLTRNLDKKLSNSKCMNLSSPIYNNKTKEMKTPPKLKDLKMVNEKIKSKMVRPSIQLIDPMPMKKRDEDTDNPNFKEKSLLEFKFIMKNPQDVEDQVNTAIKSWITLDTLMFVHGEHKIKEILDKNKLSEYFDKLKISQSKISQQKRYMEICKILQLQELLEDTWDNDNVGSNKFQPLRNYSKLKKETKELDVKVKTFYGGMLYEADDSNFPVPEPKENEESVDEERVPAVLPLVDINSLTVVRRRVLLTSLSMSVKFYLSHMKYKFPCPLIGLQGLVNTFKLNADNVVFPPAVWNYLAVLCLKILALSDTGLNNMLKGDEAIELELLMLKRLPGKNCIVLQCMNLINDVDNFIENYVTLNT